MRGTACRRVAVFFLVLFAAGVARAYLPVQCNARFAESGFTSSEAIAIGRVTKVERVGPFDLGGPRKVQCFSYVATIAVGKAFKGPLKPKDEVLIGIGSYLCRGDDDTTPTQLATHNTHSPLPLNINGVYLLCLCREDDEAAGKEEWKGKVWKPRSCHFSIHEIIMATVAGRGERIPHVIEGRWPDKPGPPVPLSLFLKAKGL